MVVAPPEIGHRSLASGDVQRRSSEVHIVEGVTGREREGGVHRRVHMLTLVALLETAQLEKLGNAGELCLRRWPVAEKKRVDLVPSILPRTRASMRRGSAPRRSC
jgi:hypothetical protein